MKDNFWTSNDCEASTLSLFRGDFSSNGEMDANEAIRDLDTRISELERALNINVDDSHRTPQEMDKN